MSKATALRLAAARKQGHIDAWAETARLKEEARKKWDWDHFEPMVYGSPRNMTQVEYAKIIDDARLNHRNVMFGGYDGLEPIPPPRGSGFVNSVLNFLWI